MSPYNILYNSLILVAFLLSFIAFTRGYKRFGILSLLLFITSMVELSALYLIDKKTDFTWLYHIYNVIEYTLFCSFLVYSIASKRIVRLVKISIPFFVLSGLSLSYFKYQFTGFPGLNINIEGFLLSVICLYILFNLEVIEEGSIFNNYNFWICAGILIFFGTTFFFNGVFARISSLSLEKAMLLFSTINRPLNVILYSFIITGVSCLLASRKHIIQ